MWQKLLRLTKMKKRYILFLFLSIGTLTSAQNFRGGIFAGLNGAQIKGDHLAGFDKTGFQIGAFVNRPIKNDFEWQLEIMYITKGSREPNDDQGASRLYRVHLGYVEVPLLILWNLNDKISFEAGPSVGVLVNSLEEDRFGELSVSRPFNRFNLFSNLGFNYRFAENWHMNFTLNLSLSPIREHPSGATVFNIYEWNLGQYNQQVSFSLFYRFDRKQG